MKYTIDMFREDFPRLDYSVFETMNFRYAIAQQDMLPFGGDWSNDRDIYQFKFACVNGITSGGTQFVYKMNVHQYIKKNEVFICATSQNGILHSAIRPTGVMTISYPCGIYKRKDGKDKRIASFLFKKLLKKQRPIWHWFNKEMGKLQDKAREVTRELNNNFYYMEFESDKKTVEYLFKAKTKRIKTNYGIKNNCYSSDFKLNKSPYDSEVISSYSDLKKRFNNHDAFSGAYFPLYLIKHNEHIYLFEKNDFEHIEKPEVKSIEIEYVNKWEDCLVSLQKKEKALKRWRERAMRQIEDHVYSSFPEYRER